MHTESVGFAPRKSRRAWCAQRDILAQVLNQRVVFPERRIESHRNKKCSNFYAKDLPHDAERKRLQCA